RQIDPAILAEFTDLAYDEGEATLKALLERSVAEARRTHNSRRPVNRIKNRLSALFNIMQNNCGTGEGGFQPGNDCGKGDGSGDGSKDGFVEIETPTRIEKDDFYKRTSKGEKVKDATGDTVNFGKR